MRIILTVNAAWNIWNFRRTLVAALLADGHQVTILAPSDETVDDLRAMGCAFEPLVMSRKGLNPIDDLALVRRMRTAFARLQPDLVFSFTVKNNVFGALASRGMRHRFVPNVTGLGTAFLSGAAMRWMVEALYRSAFAGLPTVFFQNEDDIALFVQRRLVSQAQVIALPGSGIDLAHFAPAPYPDAADGVRFLMIARLLRDKGVVEYADAARMLRAQFPQARFQLLGRLDEGNRTAIAHNMLQMWIEEGVIDYLGCVDDVRPALAAAHCIVLPSYREGAPRTLIEGAALARPAITTDVPGCRAVVNHGTTGLICEAKSAKSLAESMAAFQAMAWPQQQAMGVAARNRIAAGFSDAIVIDHYRRQISRLASERQDKQAGARAT